MQPLVTPCRLHSINWVIPCGVVQSAGLRQDCGRLNVDLVVATFLHSLLQRLKQKTNKAASVCFLIRGLGTTYSTYYKPMGDLHTSALNRRWAYNTYLAYIRIYHIYVPIQELRAEEGGGLIIHHELIIRPLRYAHIVL